MSGLNPPSAPGDKSVMPAKPAMNQVSGQFKQVSGQQQKAKTPPALPEGKTLLDPKDLFRSKAPKGKSVPVLPLVDPVAPAAGKTTHATTGSGYYPHDSKLEGGFHDMKGKSLHTLQDFLEGKSKYVSVAMDEDMYAHIIADRREAYQKTGKAKYKKYLSMEPKISYGDTFRIPELEKKYGRKIVFKAVDTGGAFKGKDFSRIDIATRSEKHSKEKTINGPLTMVMD